MWRLEGFGRLLDRLVRHVRGFSTLRFSSFDLDGNGYIDMEELKHLLSGEWPTRDVLDSSGGAALVSDVLPDGHTIDEVMEEVSGGDGVISFSRFRQRTQLAVTFI